MSKRQRSPAGPVADFGAVMARVDVVDVADPAAPNTTIRRARVRCQHDTLWRRGGITDGEREAADRFAVTCEAAAGARERAAVGMPAQREPHRQGHPADAQVAAITSLRGVQQTLGNDANALLLLYVRDNYPAEEIARRRGEGEKLTAGRIRAALTRLAEHWGMA